MVPLVALASTGHNDGFEVDPCLSDKVCSLVVVEDRDFELEVVWRFVDGKA
jgi:hypothetical protein